jgi:fructoselysine-6-P-deglycase FrlB-like protein
MSAIEREILTQPADWRHAATLAPAHTAALPQAGERVVAVGCGTSLHMAHAYAAAREAAGAGETDAFPASEMPAGRRYDRMVAISRSGTTSEVVRLLDAASPGPPTLSTSTASEAWTGSMNGTAASRSRRWHARRRSKIRLSSPVSARS